MSIIRTAAAIGVVVVGYGVLVGGPVLRTDGTVDVGGTVKQGAEIGGTAAGDAAGKITDGAANGAASGVGEAVAGSKVAQAVAGGAGAVTVYKGYQRWFGSDLAGAPVEPPSDAGDPIVPQPAPVPDPVDEDVPDPVDEDVPDPVDEDVPDPVDEPEEEPAAAASLIVGGRRVDTPPPVCPPSLGTVAVC